MEDSNLDSYGWLETKGFEPLELDGIQRPGEPPLRADSDKGGVVKLAGSH